MAFVAWYGYVSPFNGVAGAVVVERFRTHLPPACGVVAVGAIRPKAPGVRIAMAGTALTMVDGTVTHKAAIRRRVDERLEHVAFVARYVYMTAAQNKARGAMVEAGGRAPT